MNGERVKFYEDERKDWRWRLSATNGKIIGASSEGYTDRRDAIVNFRTVTRREIEFIAVRGAFDSAVK